MPLPNYTNVTDGVSLVEAANINPVYSDLLKMARATASADYAHVRTLMSDLTLTDMDLPIQSIDTGGSARTIELPSASSDNGAFFVWNRGAEPISVVDAASTTIATVTPATAALFFSDGAAWTALSGGGGGGGDVGQVALISQSFG